MSARTATIEYMPTATFGSEAYDLDRVLGFGDAEVYEQPRRRERVREEERALPKTRTRAKAHAHAKPVGVSLFAVLGYALTAVMMVFVLLSYVQLAEISGSMTELETKYAELAEEGKKLTVAYECAFNLADVEDYAVNELNMTKLTDSQITVLNIDKADKAEILAGKETKGNIITGSAEFITSLMAYLK